MIKNTPKTYGSMAKFFHWIIAILIIGMLIFGFILVNLKTTNPYRETLIGLHKSIGLTILLLVILRLIWRFVNIQPPFPVTVPLWEQISAKSAHFFLYILIFVMIFSGWSLSSFGGHPVVFWNLFDVKLPVAKNQTISSDAFLAHKIIGWALIGLVSLHILGALKNHFIDKNHILNRMLPVYKLPSLFKKLKQNDA